MFEKILDTHLKAIKERDLDTFLSTVDTENVLLILANGKIVNTGEEFIEFHKDWFSDLDWSIDYRVFSKTVKSTFANVVLDINYNDVDENNNKIQFSYYLTLIFEKNNDTWLLIHDQNTSY